MIKKLAATGVLGFAMTASALAAAPAAFAGGDDHRGKRGGGSFSNNETSGNFSVLGGNQVFVPISAPINACGNAVAVIGLAGAGCKAEAEVEFE